MAREISKVQVTITEIQGRGECPVGFKKGDTWVIDSYITPTNFCMVAFVAIYPKITTMRHGGESPWGKESDVTYACCTDWNNPVTYEIRRLPPE